MEFAVKVWCPFAQCYPVYFGAEARAKEVVLCLDKEEELEKVLKALPEHLVHVRRRDDCWEVEMSWKGGELRCRWGRGPSEGASPRPSPLTLRPAGLKSGSTS